MVPAGSHQRPQGPPLIYVTRFASHRGGVWQLRGPRGLRHQGPRLEACSAVERAAVESGPPPGRELPTGTQARVAAIPDSTSFQLRRSKAPRAPGAPRGLEQAERAGDPDFVQCTHMEPYNSSSRELDAPLLVSLDIRDLSGLNQKTAAKEFDFPIPLNEASKTMKDMKKVLAWKKVSKVISRMIAENENYRHRLKCQNLSSEI